MKKFIAIFILLATISVSSYAGDGLYVAPKVGFGMSNFNGSVKSVFKGSVSAGLALGYDMSLIGLEASAMYRSAGATITGNDGTEGSLRSHYMSVPVVAKLFLIGSFHVYLGPQFDFLLAENLKVDGVKTSTELLKGTTISGVAGAGLSLPLNFGLALNYNFGLSNVSSTSDLANVSAGSVVSDFVSGMDGFKNQNISIVLSYKF